MTAKLTVKQHAFVEQYLIDLNGTRAAIRAGYSQKTAQEQASRLLSNAMVQDAVALAMKTKAERNALTQDLVIQGLLTEAQREGEGTSHSARITAWAHLGKHLGMFADKAAGGRSADGLEHGSVQEMSDSDLLAQIESLFSTVADISATK